jgi:glycosyltransferase involved in cell wall biosynthesis
VGTTLAAPMTGRRAWAVVTHTMLPNGPSHRLVDALRRDGHTVGFCAVPLPGGSRRRAERLLPGDRASEILVDEARRVSPVSEVRSVLDVTRFAWQVAGSGCREVALVGCDPVAFLEAWVAFRTTPVRVRTSVIWFVDWSAQRLDRPASAAAYRLATRGALRMADVTAAISPDAARALIDVGRARSEVLVLPNQYLNLGIEVPWTVRPPAVAYVGGLSEQQGVDVLLGAAAVLGREGVTVDIVGDGPARSAVSAAVVDLPGVHFHGLVEDVAGLAEVMLRARVGWALYDPRHALHGYNDPLKVKDYLAAGMRVVSTLPRSVEDGVISRAQHSVAAVVDATRRALVEPPLSTPSNHPVLVEASQLFSAFVSAVGLDQ